MSVPLITEKDLNSKSGDFFIHLQNRIINNIEADDKIVLSKGQARFIDRFFANLDKDILEGASPKGNELSDYLSLIGEKVESKDALGAAFGKAFEFTKENRTDAANSRLYNKLSLTELNCVKKQLDQLLGDFWEYVEKVKSAELERKAQEAAEKTVEVGRFAGLLKKVAEQKENENNVKLEPKPSLQKTGNSTGFASHVVLNRMIDFNQIQSIQL